MALHPLATPLRAARAEGPTPSHQTLTDRYGVTAPTMRKWRERDLPHDLLHRPYMLHCTLPLRRSQRSRW